MRSSRSTCELIGWMGVFIMWSDVIGLSLAVCWCMLMCFDVWWCVSVCVLMCVDVCWRVSVCVHVRWCLLTCLFVCRRVLVCVLVHYGVCPCVCGGLTEGSIMMENNNFSMNKKSQRMFTLFHINTRTHTRTHTHTHTRTPTYRHRDCGPFRVFSVVDR